MLNPKIIRGIETIALLIPPYASASDINSYTAVPVQEPANQPVLSQNLDLRLANGLNDTVSPASLDTLRPDKTNIAEYLQGDRPSSGRYDLGGYFKRILENVDLSLGVGAYKAESGGDYSDTMLQVNLDIGYNGESTRANLAVEKRHNFDATRTSISEMDPNQLNIDQDEQAGSTKLDLSYAKSFFKINNTSFWVVANGSFETNTPYNIEKFIQNSVGVEASVAGKNRTYRVGAGFTDKDLELDDDTPRKLHEENGLTRQDCFFRDNGPYLSLEMDGSLFASGAVGYSASYRTSFSMTQSASLEATLYLNKLDSFESGFWNGTAIQLSINHGTMKMEGSGVNPTWKNVGDILPETSHNSVQLLFTKASTFLERGLAFCPLKGGTRGQPSEKAGC